MHNAGAAKSYAEFNTQLSLNLHLSAPAMWQYTLNATQSSMNQHTVSSLHYRARTPAHRVLKRTTKYLLNDKMTHRSTYATPDLPPTLAARLAVRKGIHSNKYRPVNSFKPTRSIPLRSFLIKTHSQKMRRFVSDALNYITPH